MSNDEKVVEALSGLLADSVLDNFKTRYYHWWLTSRAAGSCGSLRRLTRAECTGIVSSYTP